MVLLPPGKQIRTNSAFLNILRENKYLFPSEKICALIILPKLHLKSGKNYQDYCSRVLPEADEMSQIVILFYIKPSSRGWPKPSF